MSTLDSRHANERRHSSVWAASAVRSFRLSSSKRRTRTLLPDVRLRVESSVDVLIGVTRPSAITESTVARAVRLSVLTAAGFARSDSDKETQMGSFPFNYFQSIFIHDNPVAYRREVARYLDLIQCAQ